MNGAYRTGLAAVIVGAIAVFVDLPAGWTFAGGILALGLGAAALVSATRSRSGHRA